MKVEIEFNAEAFNEEEILNVINQIADKILEQSLWESGCLDEELEDQYTLKCAKGSVCGTILVTDVYNHDMADDMERVQVYTDKDLHRTLGDGDDDDTVEDCCDFMLINGGKKTTLRSTKKKTKTYKTYTKSPRSAAIAELLAVRDALIAEQEAQ
jgi:hypothetical protein